MIKMMFGRSVSFFSEVQESSARNTATIAILEKVAAVFIFFILSLSEFCCHFEEEEEEGEIFSNQQISPPEYRSRNDSNSIFTIL